MTVNRFPKENNPRENAASPVDSSRPCEASVVIETNLTEEEKAILRQGREDFAKGDYVTLELD